MVDYWVTRRGIRRGNVLNPIGRLYKSYLRWMASELPLETPETLRAFRRYFDRRGFLKMRNKNHPCYLLSKRIAQQTPYRSPTVDEEVIEMLKKEKMKDYEDL